MQTLATIGQIAGWTGLILASAGLIVTAIAVISILRHKHIPESTLSEWDKKMKAI